MLKKIFMFFMNPRLLLCLGIAWMITNGWSYVMLALGTAFGIEWMMAVSGAYIAFLWLPIQPERIAMIAIAMWLLRLLFPRDEATLNTLHSMMSRIREVIDEKRPAKLGKHNKHDAK